MKEAKYVLSNRHLYYFINEIVKRGDPTVQKSILTRIIQDLKPEHCRDVFRAAVKAASEDATTAGRLSRTIIRGVDYISSQNRRTQEIASGLDNVPD
jgi:hypothetical protein